MQIIAYTVSRDKGILRDDGVWRNTPPYLDFLLKPFDDAIRVFSDLDSDVAGLLGVLGLTRKELGKLADNKEVWLGSRDSGNLYRLGYIPGKWFSIDKGIGEEHLFAGFSDMGQYDEELLKVGVLSVEDRVKRAKQVGENVYKVLCELGLSPKSLISPVNAYRKGVLDTLDLPTVEDVPVDALEIAYECCLGSWVEAYQIGKWDKVYDYDINSAYPYYASQLQHLRAGEWKRSRDYEEDAVYGYTRCKLEITSDFSPILFVQGDNTFTPKGKFERSLTKKQIEFIHRHKLGYTAVQDGWWWYPSKDYLPNKPLYSPITLLYAEKQRAEGLRRDIIKRIMAGSFYGLWLETRGNEFGEHFMSPWGAEIETGVQLQIAEACLTNSVMPLHIAVDGVIVERPLDLQLNDDLGGWRLEHSGECYIMSSGLVTMSTKAGRGDFSVHHNWLKEQIAESPKSDCYSMSKLSVLSLAQAKNLGRIADVGKVEEITRSVSIGDNKRLYANIPKNFGQLVKRHYPSEPWTSEMLKLLGERKE